MKKSILKSVTYKKWDKYYSNCDLQCNNGKYCPFQFGNACIGDILQNKNHEDGGKTLLQVIEEFIAKREEAEQLDLLTKQVTNF